jgi:bacteriocin biosynthesis cyclodehydratase domain-containing protein
MSGAGSTVEGRKAPESDVARRLKRSVEVFPASDGTLYLLQSGLGRDLVVQKPTERDRLLLEALSAGFVTESELTAACEKRGIPSIGVAGALADLESAGLIERAALNESLTQAERTRYDRQLLYFTDLLDDPTAYAEDRQAMLRDATATIIGTGGLGSWTACGLACGGVGSLILIDDDRVEISNLNRQILFGMDDVGALKVEAAERALSRHNPALRVQAVNRRVSNRDDANAVIEGSDVVITVADWPPYELPRWVNSAAVAAGIPHVSAGQQLPVNRVGPTVIPGRSACLECEEGRVRAEYPLFDELVDFRIGRRVPAAAIGAASGILGSMLAMEAIHLLTGTATPATVDAVLMFDTRTLEVTREAIERDPECPVCGV